jgi:hypothetical protein
MGWNKLRERERERAIPGCHPPGGGRVRSGDPHRIGSPSDWEEEGETNPPPHAPSHSGIVSRHTRAIVNARLLKLTRTGTVS